VLCALYCQLLGRDRLSVETSFFEAGGNSLQAMQLLGAVKAELGVDIGVTEVFLAPSARQLAARIDARAGSTDPAERPDVLVELAASEAGQPLLLVHAVGGTVFSYVPLAAELADRYRVYGLQSPVLVGQQRAVHDLPELAVSYLSDLRAVQPIGPYRLGGWSMGGLLAYELARELERQDETVELLILLDAPFALDDDPCRPDELARYFVADSLRTLGRPEDPIEGEGVEECLDRLAILLEPSGGAAVRAEVGRRFEAFCLHRRLMSGYRPDGQVRAPALLVGAQHSVNAPAQARWQALLPNAERHVLDADHYSLLRPPVAGQLAKLVESKARVDASAAS